MCSLSLFVLDKTTRSRVGDFCDLFGKKNENGKKNYRQKEATWIKSPSAFFIRLLVACVLLRSGVLDIF